MVYIARCTNESMQSWSPRMRNPKYLMVYIARCTNESMQSWSPRIRNPKYLMVYKMYK